MARETDDTVAARRRMSPNERRAQIIDAARTLFSDRPVNQVSTADVAAQAGVARSLVHHYFGGINEVFWAVVASSGAQLSDERVAGTETPLEERLARNAAAGLDVIAANRETWLAIMGHGSGSADPQINAMMVALRERSVNRMLEANSDVLHDTPMTRLALRCFQAFLVEAVRGWMSGEQTREDTERLLVVATVQLVRDTIPALEATGAG
jgi:AcrR family transcriptional regulator